MGLINEYLRPLLQKLSLKSLHKRVEAIADSPIAAKNSDDFKGNMDQPDPTPKVSESRPLPPNKVRVRSEKAKTLNGGLQKASKKKEEKLAAASLVQESRTRIGATPNARTSSAGSSLSRLIITGNKRWNRADGSSATDEVGDGAVWREKILMGKRCKPLKVDGGGKNSVLVEAAASEVGNGMKGPAAMTVAEERNRIVVSLERKCLDEDYPFPSRQELDTDPYVLGWLYIADICDYNTSSSHTSMTGSATGGDSMAQSDSGKVLWSTKRRRSLSVMSRYLRR